MKTYGYIYFIFAGYRIAIGRTTNICNRLRQYKRTHFSPEVIGVIPCADETSLEKNESQILKQCQPYNAFRDMFYLTPELKDWIINNTIDATDAMQEGLQKRRKNKQAYRKKRRATDPKYRKNESRHRREYQREYQRKRRAKKNTKHSRNQLTFLIIRATATTPDPATLHPSLIGFLIFRI